MNVFNYEFLDSSRCWGWSQRRIENGKGRLRYKAKLRKNFVSPRASVARAVSQRRKQLWKLRPEDDLGSPAGVATTVRVIFPMNYIGNKEQSEMTRVAKPLCPKDNNGFRDGA